LLAIRVIESRLVMIRSISVYPRSCATIPFSFPDGLMRYL
jgi:hypothetical protein